jgi:hypothetical protein
VALRYRYTQPVPQAQRAHQLFTEGGTAHLDGALSSRGQALRAGVYVGGWNVVGIDIRNTTEIQLHRGWRGGPFSCCCWQQRDDVQENVVVCEKLHLFQHNLTGTKNGNIPPPPAPPAQLSTSPGPDSGDGGAGLHAARTRAHAPPARCGSGRSAGRGATAESMATGSYRSAPPLPRSR